MTIIQGDLGGLIFRDDSHQKSYYYRLGQDGSYYLVYYLNFKPSGPLTEGRASAFNTGFNQTNLIAVEVQGGMFQLYVNDHFVDSVNVGTYGQGYIGLFATDHGNPTEVVFQNAKVWTF
jgi:hypothetical protein